MMIQKSIIILLITLYVTPIYSQFRKLENKNHGVNKVLEEVIQDTDFKNASFSFLAIDANSGEIISQHNSDLALKPASTQKLITTATMLELYGAEYKIKTTIEYTGKIDTIRHILYGDIIIKGGGDPTLGSKYFDETKNKQFLTVWTNAIKKLQIDSIAGSVIADASIYSYDIVPQTWTWNNMGNYFGAGACGLSIYDNYYSLYFNSSNTYGDTTQIVECIPDIPDLVFENEVIADSISYDNAYIYGAPYSNIRYLRGEIPLNKTRFKVKGSMPDPAYIAANELEKALIKAGIKFKNNATSIRRLKLNGKYIDEKRTEIDTVFSPQLSKIITQTNIHSINLFAEHFLNEIGLKLIDKPNTEIAAKAVMEYWQQKGMDTQGMYLVDGSGLSHYNVITPRQMVFVLNYMKHQSKNFDVYYNSLAIGGETGTITKMFKKTAAKGNIRAKSGTITHVKCYSGYVKSASGREIIFSMFANNFSCSSRQAKEKLEKIMVALANFKK